MSARAFRRVRSVLIVAPHADDEAIGAWGLIRRLVRRGAAVRVLIVTDGAGSHRNSPTWPRARLVRERRRESCRVLARLGVARGSVGFLALPDYAAPPLGPGGPRLVARAAARSRGMALLVGPCRTDDHPDHRAVAEALGRTRLPGTRRLSYLVWPEARARSRRTMPFAIGAAGAAAKRAALRGYRTQAGAIRDDPDGFEMTAAQLRGFARPIEWFAEERR